MSRRIDCLFLQAEVLAPVFCICCCHVCMSGLATIEKEGPWFLWRKTEVYNYQLGSLIAELSTGHFC